MEWDTLTSALIDYSPVNICEFDGASYGDVMLFFFLGVFYVYIIKKSECVNT